MEVNQNKVLLLGGEQVIGTPIEMFICSDLPLSPGFSFLLSQEIGMSQFIRGNCNPFDLAFSVNVCRIWQGSQNS